MNPGTGFEQVVADVCRELDPGADVQLGLWEEGPDGRRNLDVVINGQLEGQPRRIHIGCKDYNPDRGTIGIEFVDAIASKHEDMNVDVSLLCSNAGFSSSAISKAKRKNIGLIGVLRANDSRVKYEIVDVVYARRIEMDGTCGVAFHLLKDATPISTKDPTAILHKGKPVINWMIGRIPLFLTVNLVLSGKTIMRYTFKQPISVRHAVARKKSRLEWCEITFTYSGTWVAFESRITASSGLYDWLRKAIRVGPGRSFSIEWKDVTVGVGGTELHEPPKHLFPDWPYNNPANGIAYHAITDIGNLRVPPPEEIPNLDPFVVPTDLELRGSGLPEDVFYPAKR